MAQRVTAIFISREAADRAANALVDLGAENEHISMLARGEQGTVTSTPATGRQGEHDFVEPAREVGDSGAALTTTNEGDAAKGAAVGAVAGLAAGLLALTIPGIGLVLAAGPLALAAASGAIAGGVYGGLRDIGVDETAARGYEERLRGGNVLLTAVIPPMSEARVRVVLDEHDAEDISFNEDISTVSPSGYSATPAAGSPTASTAGYNANIARGESKKAEGEMRDRAADMTANPLDDLAAKGKKVEGEIQEEYGEAEEVVQERR